MSYACPKCGGPAQRGSSSVAGHAGGVVGMLLYAAFAGFNCARCGKLERASFPPEVQSKMTMNSVLMGVGAAVLLVAVLALVAAIN
jgi:hypothetical protein